MDQENIVKANADQQHDNQKPCLDRGKNGERNSTDSVSDTPINRNEEDTTMVGASLAY